MIQFRPSGCLFLYWARSSQRLAFSRVDAGTEIPAIWALLRAITCQPTTDVSLVVLGWYRHPPRCVSWALTTKATASVAALRSFGSFVMPYASHSAMVASPCVYMSDWSSMNEPFDF